MRETTYKRKFLLILGLFLSFALSQATETSARQKTNDERLQFSISFSKKLCSEALDGRLLLIVSTEGDVEPRLQMPFFVGWPPETQQIFGIGVERLAPGGEAVFDDSAFGFPLRRISDIPSGEYWIQAILHRYETFHRADGHVLKLPMDQGEGQHWNMSPGNLYSTPRKVTINPDKNETIKIVLENEIPPFPEIQDTKHIKYVRIQSKLLTEFWGRPMYLGAFVLIPHGFDEHPQARYPIVICHGHFRRFFRAPAKFRETPPDDSLSGSERTIEEYAFKLCKDWTSVDFSRVLLVTIQHPNPYFDDSYAVNSANIGPYGDAITYELIPHIEKTFRGIGEGWSRFLYGGSTGGWASLAAQIFYPDEYNGCWAFCPDQIDFRAYTIVNIYEDENAYYTVNGWRRTPKPGSRSGRGEIMATLEENNHYELVLGTRSRSGRQWDAWQAVFGPVGDDGYPKPIWNKLTGEIDRSVAEYYRENYDLRYILERDWAKLGPKLKGKIHIYVGDMDNFYLENAVRLMEQFLESTTDPYYDGVVEYGDGYTHCWGGDHKMPQLEGYLTVFQRFLPKMVERMEKTAPPGADLKSWRY